MTRPGSLSVHPWLLLLCLAACAREGEAPAGRPVPRAERYGIFADLVLYPRLDELGGPFFIDRFETTVADYHSFLVTTGRPPPAGADSLVAGVRNAHDDAMPVVKVNYEEARAFARWRWCRLLRSDEWRFAATAGGEYRYPWGNRHELIWSNTADLGLMRRTPVGTFESGRQSFGSYDLIGNVAEWTETVPHWFYQPEGEGFVDGARFFRLPHGGLGQMFLRRSHAVRLSWLPWAPLPAGWLAAAVPAAPREVVGGDFGHRMHRDAYRASIEMSVSEWSDHVGIRVATTPKELVSALLQETDPSAPLLDAVRRFAARPAHQRSMRQALKARLSVATEEEQQQIQRLAMFQALQGQGDQ